MTQFAAALLADYRTGKITLADFKQAAKDVAGLPELLAAALDVAHCNRDTKAMGWALMAALAVPDRKLTPVLCRIALDRDWLFGSQEMALEALIDIDDPAALEPMTELCSRTDLKWDQADWRKALLVMFGRNNEPSRIVEALEAVVRSDSSLKRDATEYLHSARAVGRL